MKTNKEIIDYLAQKSINPSDFRVVSLDSSVNPQVIMIDSTKSIYNFDDIKDKLYKNMNSCDGIIFNNEDIILIEFKNGVLEWNEVAGYCVTNPTVLCDEVSKRKKTENRLRKRDLANKVSDSLLIISDLTEDSLQNLKTKISYILVYNSVKNPLDEIHMIAAKNACKPMQRFGLGVKYGKFCKTIETLTVDEFKAKYSAYV